MPASLKAAMKATSKGTSRVLYWFRTDLRITDSPALAAALALNPEAFVPIWCWDPSYIYGHRVGLNRWQFLLESMSDLSSVLTGLNPRQKLHVLRGRPQQLLPHLCKAWGITHIVWEKDSNAYAKVRDKEVKGLMAEIGVEVVDVPGRHLFDPDLVVQANKGKPTMTLNQWQKVICLNCYVWEMWMIADDAELQYARGGQTAGAYARLFA
jgi:cryptochrome